MTIYIVKNERQEEMGAFADPDRARELAENLRDEFNQQYVVEEFPCDALQEHALN